MILTTEMLKEKFQSYSNKLDKIKREALAGNILRINRGLYETNRNTNSYLLASSIQPRSYLSFEWALSYYGLIPERVVSITSASFMKHKNITINNIFGRYEYSDIPIKAFSEGTTLLEEGEYSVRIATKEKALCDSLYKWPVINSIKSLKELMFIDKRIDIDEFKTCDFKLLLYLTTLYNRKNLFYLNKLIKKEYSSKEII